MYRRIEDFLKDWEGESAATVKVFRALTEAALAQRVDPEGRALGRIAWHIVQTIPEMGGKAGLDIEGPAETDPRPSLPAMIETYQAAATSLARAVARQWTDIGLEEEIEMYGEHWGRGETLNALVKHQVHHRGQMTVLMRQAGLTVPGFYGPAREEWAQFGMEAPE